MAAGCCSGWLARDDRRVGAVNLGTQSRVRVGQADAGRLRAAGHRLRFADRGCAGDRVGRGGTADRLLICLARRTMDGARTALSVGCYAGAGFRTATEATL